MSEALDRRRRNTLVVAIHRAVVACFNDSDWRSLGYQTDTLEWVEGHHRLLRSLSWGDEDYSGHALSAITEMLKADPVNLQVMLDTPKIAAWLRENEPALYGEFVGGDTLSVASPTPRITSQVVEAAIKDAEHLIPSRGAVNGLDRVHTTLHGYLLVACDDAGITYGDDPGVTDLYKLLRRQHPALQATGPRADDVEKILRSFSAVLDAMNPLRNRASLAHPNPTLLAEAEAMLVINAARTILHYLDAKFKEAGAGAVPGGG
jgi:hypothetical protein